MRALVIEDDPKLSRLLRTGLSEQGFTVDVARDGEEGLALASTEPYDAVVLDLMIPKVEGTRVLRELRAAGRDVPVLILTARDGAESKVAGLDAGADDYMTKPFTFAELAARLRALIRRTHRVADSVIRVGDLEVDTGARRVRRGGRTIELRAKEYALLELLALRAGHVVTRSQILDHIYAHDSETLSNVVDVHLCRLRSMIDREPARPLIRTIRGQGYVLEAT
jgi:DNA-binding response OmpR family regulator